ncbi:MAG: YkgJ family cysteine cluster protein [Desulfuromonadales bacterium]|nr:YkgJ family cysteine cluster protein [Desulfuromonadales bacterium]
MQDIIEQYRFLLETVDAWFNQSQQRFSQEIHCRSGCSGCCRGFFDITLLDAALVSYGYQQLAAPQRKIIHARALSRLSELQRRWPGFASPFLLNGLPDAEWTVMPEEDETPCPFLGAAGLCAIYLFRPMTCRLHGLPNIDFSGESFSDQCCSLNFIEVDPLSLTEIRSDFRATFTRELDLFHAFTTQLIGRPMNELDLLLPLVPLLDFDRTDWQNLVFYSLLQPLEPSE